MVVVLFRACGDGDGGGGGVMRCVNLYRVVSSVFKSHCVSCIPVLIYPRVTEI